MQTAKCHQEHINYMFSKKAPLYLLNISTTTRCLQQDFHFFCRTSIPSPSSGRARGLKVSIHLYPEKTIKFGYFGIFDTLYDDDRLRCQIVYGLQYRPLRPSRHTVDPVCTQYTVDNVELYRVCGIYAGPWRKNISRRSSSLSHQSICTNV